MPSPADVEAPAARRWVEFIMGTAISLDLRDPWVPENAVAAAFDSLRADDARFSTYREDSELRRIQRGELPLRTPPTTCSRSARTACGSRTRQRAPSMPGAIGPRACSTHRPGEGLGAGARGHRPGQRRRAQLLPEWRRRRDRARPARRAALARRHSAPAGTHGARPGARADRHGGRHVCRLRARGSRPRPVNGGSGRAPAERVCRGADVAVADGYATALFVAGADGVARIARRAQPWFEAVLITTDHRVLTTPGIEPLRVRR